jgi:hypothetical protein
VARGTVRRSPAGAGARYAPEVKSAVVAGAAANTNIPVAGIKTRDQLILVTEHAAGAVPVDRTADTSITSAGNIQSTDITTGNTLVVLWHAV